MIRWIAKHVWGNQLVRGVARLCHPRILLPLLLASSLVIAVSGTVLGVVRYQHDVKKKQVVSTHYNTCLSGQWREIEFSEESEFEGDGEGGGKVTLTGSGRLVRFEDDIETIEYGPGVTYSGETAWYQVNVHRTGTIRHRIHVQGDQLHFTGLSADGSEQVVVNGVELSKQPLGLGSALLTFACEKDKLTLSDTGYRSILERVRLAP